jgi:GAF domain-containing protein
VPRDLKFVTSVAAQLMEANTFTATSVSEEVLARLVDRFDADTGFLRHNDQTTETSKLIVECPPRPNRVIRPPASTNYAYKAFRREITGRRRVATPSMATAPLVSKTVITGVLGFVNFRGRKWKKEELGTLRSVASLFAQLQARIAAEEKLRYLAEYDDLTGLRNRR